jgi:uncharacterized RDD family membrane protein YckC
MSLAEERPHAAPRAAGAAPRAREVAARVHSDPAAPGEAPVYQGLVTRTLAFALDCAAINLVAIAVGVAVGLAVSVLDLPSEVETALVAVGGVAWFLWSAGYFVVCWATTGQTPGDRLLHIRVCDADDFAPLPAHRAALRLVYLTLAAIPLFAGFLPILFDDRRRGVHDMLAGSVVIGTDPS